MKKILTPERKIELFDAMTEVIDKYEPLVAGKPVVSSIEELFKKYHDVVVERDVLLNVRNTILGRINDAVEWWDQTKDTCDLMEALEEILGDFGV
jgi:hypothetical protein